MDDEHNHEDEVPDLPEGIPDNMQLHWQGDGSEMPPFIRQAIEYARQQQLHHQMAATDRYHSQIRFLEEASQDHLAAHLTILQTCDDGENVNIAFCIGYAQGIMKMRFGVCPAHDVNHDEELTAMGTPAEGETGEPEAK